MKLLKSNRKGACLTTIYVFVKLNLFSVFSPQFSCTQNASLLRIPYDNLGRWASADVNRDY